MLEVKNVSYTYKKGNTISFPDFEIGAGEHCLLLGESGSGKTTLLHLLGGLLRNYSGNIQLAGTELSSLSDSALDKFRGRKIGFVFQKNHLISALSVEKNLILSPYLAGIPQDHHKVTQLLEDLGLEGKQKSSVKALSHGQAQRVAIARAVLNHPAIILADEPTSALDDKNCQRVIELLLRVARQNDATLIVATHDQRLKSTIDKQIRL